MLSSLGSFGEHAEVSSFDSHFIKTLLDPAAETQNCVSFMKVLGDPSSDLEKGTPSSCPGHYTCACSSGETTEYKCACGCPKSASVSTIASSSPVPPTPAPTQSSTLVTASRSSTPPPLTRIYVSCMFTWDETNGAKNVTRDGTCFLKNDFNHRTEFSGYWLQHNCSYGTVNAFVISENDFGTIKECCEITKEKSFQIAVLTAVQPDHGSEHIVEVEGSKNKYYRSALQIGNNLLEHYRILSQPYPSYNSVYKPTTTVDKC